MAQVRAIDSAKRRKAAPTAAPPPKSPAWQAAHTAYNALTAIVPNPFHRVSQALYDVKQLRKHKKHLPYDDATGEFFGGDMAKLTSNNYEKALRNLWKAEVVAPFLDFHDASKKDLTQARQQTDEELTDIKQLTDYIDGPEFERILSEEYTPETRRATARLLSLIMHGEAYALFTSASLLPVVKGTGAKLGMAMQVLEEAKHFIVMRALVKKLDRVYPQTYWDQMVLERVLGAKPIDRLFGMNIVIESVAMNFFSALAARPGLGPVLGFFHLDESRHSAFPQTYTQEAPLSFRLRHSPLRQRKRMSMALPLLPLMAEMEADMNTLGIDVYEFGAKCLDKIFRLAERSRFYTPLNRRDAMRAFNLAVNAMKRMQLGNGYQGWRDYTREVTLKIDPEMKKLEDEIFGTDDPMRGWTNKLLEPVKAKVAARVARGIDPRVETAA